MMHHSLGAGIIIAALAILEPSGLRADAPAQPAPSYPKKLPMRTIPETMQFAEGEVLLKYKEALIHSDDPKERARKIAELEGRLHSKYKIRAATTFQSLGIQLLRLPPGQSVSKAIEQLKKHPVVDFVEPNYAVVPLYSGPPEDKQWLDGYLWGMKAIGMQQAWDTPLFGLADHVTVAVLDSGIAYQHPDLSPQMWTHPIELSGKAGEDDDDPPNNIIDDIYGAGFCDDYASGNGFAFGDVSDGSYPHGTVVAGIIGAVYNNPAAGGTESGYVAGVHRTVKLMGMKILCGPNNIGYVADAMVAIQYAWNHKALIINASWAIASGTGDRIDSDTSTPLGNMSLKMAIQEAGANGVLFIAAAGNNAGGASVTLRNNDTTPVYPANYGAEGLDNVIAVAATSACLGPPPQNDICPNGAAAGIPMSEELSPESHFGKTTVHLAAPGKDIVSTGWDAANTPHAIALLGDGTSFAAAHVSGCAALLQASKLATTPSSPLLPRELIKLMMDNGDPQTSLRDKTISGNRLNCYTALTKVAVVGHHPPSEVLGLDKLHELLRDPTPK